ncbi:MAG TPA: hypothetical protein VM490_05885, partial [Armatimonadaceae bacterium]|nr:hypothetical protein [Armatimonadaceae bacterium]
GILDKLKGKWKTTLGTVVTINEAMRTLPPPMLDAKARKEFENGATVQAEGFYLEANADGSASGLWTTSPSGYQEFNNVGRVYITPGADGDTFTGKVITQGGNEYTYNGTRIKEGNNGSTGNPGTTNPGNGGIVPPPVVSNPGGMARVGDGKFYRLDNFAVRFDELKVGLDEASLELIVTKRNITTKPQGIGAGGFDLMITDSDGISIRDAGNVYRPSGDRPERFDRGISVLPGGEARIRWVFPLFKGITPLKTLSIKEYVNKPVMVDISDIVLPGAGNSPAPTPTAPTAPAPAEPNAPSGGVDGLQPVGPGRYFGIDDLDVRLDGVRKGRDGATMELFVTLRNSTRQVQGFATTTVRVSVTDADGLETRHNGNLYRASGDVPERITHSVRVAPGGEAKIRFVFDVPNGSVFKKLNVSGYRSPLKSYDLPALADR